MTAKNPHLPVLASIVVLATALSGCAVVRGIFKAGVWTGVILVAVVVLLVGFIASMFRRA